MHQGPHYPCCVGRPPPPYSKRIEPMSDQVEKMLTEPWIWIGIGIVTAAVISEVLSATLKVMKAWRETARSQQNPAATRGQQTDTN